MGQDMREARLKPLSFFSNPRFDHACRLRPLRGHGGFPQSSIQSSRVATAQQNPLLVVGDDEGFEGEKGRGFSFCEHGKLIGGLGMQAEASFSPRAMGARWCSWGAEKGSQFHDRFVVCTGAFGIDESVGELMNIVACGCRIHARGIVGEPCEDANHVAVDDSHRDIESDARDGGSGVVSDSG